MHAKCSRVSGVLVAGLALLLGAAGAWGQIPQTIVIDGVNDFAPSNLIDADGGDTEFPNIDIGDVYITNDANKIYFGIQQDPAGWGAVQIGIAIDVNTPGGGTTDPFGRQIEWTLAATKPDYMFYVNLDNNWQAGYFWNGAGWSEIVPQGPGSLGWATSTGFKELAVLLSTIGVSASDLVNFEAWTTQDSPTKGPLDCVVNDGLQLSTPNFTLWDTTTPIPLTDYFPYTVQAAADNDPPVVQNTARASGEFGADSFFDVVFNEPVDPVTGQVPGNYVVGGGGGGAYPVVAATRDASQLNLVHLQLGSPMTPSGSLYTLTVTGVKDLAGNTIVANGTTNRACFMLKRLVFRGKFSLYLATNSNPPDRFTIEGDVRPFTFTPVCDTGDMADTGVDDIWEYTNLFHVSGDCVAGTASKLLQWKFMHNCTTYEPLASNRQHTLDLANGPTDSLVFWWADEDPTQFTTHDIDVEFFVDLNVYGYAPGDVVSINGSEPPLTYDVPSLNLLADDGIAPDAVAGDGIFSARLRFPAGAHKDAVYKFLLNDVYECFGQDNRHLFLNDELYDIVGGALGPLTLPVVHYDRCSTTWRAVQVVFQVDFNGTAWEGLSPSDVVSVNGTPSNGEPPTFSWDIPSLNVMHDDGAYPDNLAGDKIYAASVVFADSSNIDTEYKYLFNDVYECPTQDNRTFTVDADNHDAAGNPQVLPVDRFQQCQIVSVTTPPRKALVLGQNQPNPFNPLTEIRYLIPEAGKGSLCIYNLRGELVRTLRSGHFQAGEGVAVWDGRTDSGRQAGSGVYLYRLQVNGLSDTRQMLLLK